MGSASCFILAVVSTMAVCISISLAREGKTDNSVLGSVTSGLIAILLAFAAGRLA